MVVVVTVVPGGGVGGLWGFVSEDVLRESGMLTFVSALEKPLLVESLTLSFEDGPSKDVTDFPFECSF